MLLSVLKDINTRVAAAAGVSADDMMITLNIITLNEVS
jgi:hypothetical protein